MACPTPTGSFRGRASSTTTSLISLKNPPVTSGYCQELAAQAAVAEPSDGALTLFGSERLGHLGFQHLLHHRANDLAQPIRALRQKLFDAGDRRLRA